MRATKRALNGHLATAASEIFEAALTAESESLDDPEHRAATEALAARIRRSSERRL
jgi:hypothetical protein